jgi:hypothetical protein
MMAVVIAAIFVPLLYNRGLFTPAALVKWKSQVRNILGLRTTTFLVFAILAFALKVGIDFSRGAVVLFGIVGLTHSMKKRVELFGLPVRSAHHFRHGHGIDASAKRVLKLRSNGFGTPLCYSPWIA